MKSIKQTFVDNGGVKKTAWKCDNCGHIMNDNDYESFSICPMCDGACFTGVRFSICGCNCCKDVKVKDVLTNDDYAQFVNNLRSPMRTNIESEILCGGQEGSNTLYP